MDCHKLKQLLKQEEGPKLDFKATLNLTTESDKKEITKDVIAMANSRGGRGYIVYGVEDKTKRLLGIDPGGFKEEQIQQLIYNRCDPPVPVSVDFIDIEDKKIAVLTIFKSTHQPHQMINTGAFYIRRGSTTDTARRGEIANMLQENGLMTYETVIVKNAGLEQLDMNLINRFLSNMNVISENPSEVLLEAMGIIGPRPDGEGYFTTIGGLLLFGKKPSIYLPQVYVKLNVFDDTEYIYGNILEMLDGVSSILKSKLSQINFPVEAIEEAVANALVHRDYLDVSRGITVTISGKSIEISNPGALIASNSIYKFIKENNPDRRNPWLYQRLISLDTRKRFTKSGLGLTRIKKAFEDIGDVKFINIGSLNLFKVIMPGVDLNKA